VFVFDESVDALTLTGSAIIIATGLYTFLREHQIAMASNKLATPL
jgi:hypothetical protein